jgi:transposase InsO family protein
VSLAAFVAAQRTDHGVPHAVSCRAVDLSESWFYKWRERKPTQRQRRRAALDAMVAEVFADSAGNPGTYGSPRVHAELRDQGWVVSEKTVAASMARQGLVARPGPRRRRCLTRPDKRAEPIMDLIRRHFGADAIDVKWCGDLTEIPTGEGKLYLATVEDLASRRLAGFALGEHHDAELAANALKMAGAVRGGDVRGVIFHSDKGSEYTADLFAQTCKSLGVTQSMGRVGSALDNAVAESFNSTLEFELLSKHRFATKAEARRAVAGYIDRYNRTRRHSSCEMRSPIQYEAILAERADQAAQQTEAA